MRHWLIAATAAVAFAGASIAQAQSAPPMAPPPAFEQSRHWGMMRHDGPMMGPEHRDPARMAEHLRTVLQLRPDQEPALKALIASLPTPPSREDRMKMHEAMTGKSTPERMEAHVTRMRERLDQMQKSLNALKTFYAALTPSQQKAFEALHLGHGHMHGHMGRMGHMGQMGHDGPPRPMGDMPM